MPIKIQTAKYIPPKPREKVLISPQEKFNRFSKRLLAKGKNYQLKKFHFTVIESGKMITVFDGDGIEIAKSNNSIEGYRILRQSALRLFLDAKNQNGGFQWNSSVNLEYQTPEELIEVELKTRKNLEYKPFAICTDCKAQFQEQEELELHKFYKACNSQWTILEFNRVRRIYV